MDGVECEIRYILKNMETCYADRDRAPSAIAFTNTEISGTLGQMNSVQMSIHWTKEYMGKFGQTLTKLKEAFQLRTR